MSCDAEGPVGYWQLAANVATALSLLLAAGGLIWQIRSYRKDRAYEKSRFALESALQSFDEALRVLSDGNNNRVTWISAARIISRGQHLAKAATEPVHADLLAVQMERYRREFGKVLGFDNPEQGAWFFYGSQMKGHPTDLAAKESTAKIDSPLGTSPAIKSLSEKSLRVIYDFAQYPKDYEDPIGEGFSEAESERPGFNVMWPGLNEYIKHIREFTSNNGALTKRKPKG